MKKVTDFKAQRSNKFTIILNDNELNLFKSSRLIYQRIQNSDIPYQFIAIIKHDRDKREDDENSYKTLHYHMVITFGGRYRVGTIINWLLQLYPLLNENQITIDKCTSVEMSTRYLIHLDDPDKEPYDIWDIETNSKDSLNEYLKLEIVKDLKELVTFVRRENYNLESIMTKIADYDGWRKYINDLIVNYFRRR